MNYVIYLGILIIGSAIFCLTAWREHPSAFLSAIVLIGFSRIVPALSPAMWRGEDHYLYWLLTEPIIQTGHITAEPGQYAFANPRFHTVVLNVLTAIIRAITAVTNPETLRSYIPLIFAFGFFFGGLLILTQVFPTYQALIGAYLYTMLDVTIIESVTFTQFGFFSAISLFLFGLYYLNTNHSRWPLAILTLVFATAVALSHVAASIIFASWILMHIAMVYLYNHLPTPDIPEKMRLETVTINLSIVIIMLVVQIFILSQFFEFSILKTASSYFGPDQATTSTGVGETGMKNPGLAILNYGTIITKIILTGGAVATFVMHLRGDLLDDQERIATLAGITLAVGIVGYFASSDVFGRLLMFSYIFLIGTLLSAVLDRTHRQIIPKVVITVLVISLVILNVPAGFSPSHIDENININDDGYHQVTPIKKEGPVAGQWLAQYHDQSQTVAVGKRYSPIVFYYGETSRIRFPHITNPYSGTVLIDPKRGLTVRFESVRYYDSGRVTFQKGENIIIISDNRKSTTN